MLQQSKHAVQIDRHGAAPLLISHLINRRIFRRPHSMICHHYVQPSKSLHCRIDYLLGGLVPDKLHWTAAHLSAPRSAINFSAADLAFS